MGCLRLRSRVFQACILSLLAGRGGCSSDEDTDRGALLTWKDTILNWSEFKASNGLFGWDSTSSQCSWTGVQCSSSGRVTGLILPCPPEHCSVKAVGNFSTALWGLGELQALVLTNQSLNGELVNTKRTEGYPQGLQLIDLSGNQLTGNLPASWGSNGTLPAIQRLFLAKNSFSGLLPSAWGHNQSWQQLLVMNLQSNKLTGTLPSAWGTPGAFPNLQDMRLDNNAIGADLPVTWASNDSFPRLETMLLQNNSLNGSLSAWDHVTGLRSLRVMSLAHNSLHGSLPSGWGTPGVFTQLLTLILDDNMISGSLPSEWGKAGAFPLLRTLWLTHNLINSTLPVSWGLAGAFPKLRSLRFDRNQLSGTLPDQWGQNAGFLNLQELHLDYNGLSGELPASWGSKGAFRSLRELFLHGNALSGELPTDWGLPGRFLDLKVVSVHWNALHGRVPASWARLPSLQSAWVRPGNYQLCGKLPQQAGFALCRVSSNSSSCSPIDDLGDVCDVEPSMQELLGPAKVSELTLEAVIRLTGTNILPLTPSKIATLAEAVASCLSNTTQQHVTILQAVQVLPQQKDQPPAQAPLLAPSPSLPFLTMTSPSSSAPHHESFAVLLGRRRLQSLSSAPGPSPLPFLSVEADVTLRITAPDVHHLVTIEDDLVQMTKAPTLQQRMAKDGVNITKVQLLSTMPLEPQAAATTAAPANLVPMPAPPPSELQPSAPTGSHNSKKSAAAAAGIAFAVIGGVLLMICVAYLFVIRLRHRRTLRDRDLRSAVHGPQSPFKSDLLSDAQKLGRKTDSANTDQLIGLQSDSQSTKCPPSTGSGGHTPTMYCHLMAEVGAPPVKVTPPGAGAVRDPRSDVCLWSPPAGPPPDHQDGQGPNEDQEKKDRIARSQTASTSFGIELPQVPLSDWLIQSDEIVICRRPDGSLYELGTGAFGKVFKATRGGVQSVAVKVLKNKEDHATFGREIAILKNCRHPNIVQFQGACEKDGQIMLVTEFMESGDLFRALQKKVMQGRDKWSKCGYRIAVDIARGLCYLHDKKIVHLDLKSNNILLARDGTAKIADVGLAKVLTGAYLSDADVRGTMAYSAPELLMGKKCCEKADIYSLGVVLWEIATNERPIRGQLREVNPEQDHVPAAMSGIISDCLVSEPRERPSARQIYDRLSALEPAPRSQRQSTVQPPSPSYRLPVPDVASPPPAPLNLPNEFFPRSTTGIARAIAATSRASTATQFALTSTNSVQPQLRRTLSPFAACSTGGLACSQVADHFQDPSPMASLDQAPLAAVYAQVAEASEELSSAGSDKVT